MTLGVEIVKFCYDDYNNDFNGCQYYEAIAKSVPCVLCNIIPNCLNYYNSVLVSDSYMVKKPILRTFLGCFKKNKNKFQSGELNRSQFFRPLIVSDICQSKTPF